MVRFTQLDQGASHSLVGANPIRKSSSDPAINIGDLVRTQDSVQYNLFDIMSKQQQQL